MNCDVGEATEGLENEPHMKLIVCSVGVIFYNNTSTDSVKLNLNKLTFC